MLKIASEILPKIPWKISYLNSLIFFKIALHFNNKRTIMKIKTYFHLPALLLLAGTFLGTSSVANAIDIDPTIINDLYAQCTQTRNRDLCVLANELRQLQYEIIISKFPSVPEPPCEVVDCNTPVFIDQFKIGRPNILRNSLVDLVDKLDQEIVELDKFPR
jgi:hypothetical protein